MEAIRIRLLVYKGEYEDLLFQKSRDTQYHRWSGKSGKGLEMTSFEVEGEVFKALVKELERAAEQARLTASDILSEAVKEGMDLEKEVGDEN